MQRKQRLISLFVLVALLLSACQPLPPPPVAGAQTAPQEDVTAAINAIWEEYAASVMASDADRWIAQWTEDGVQMPPNEPLVEGKENILARTGGFMAAAPTHAMEIATLEVQSAGEWAYSRGVYTVDFTFAETGEEGAVDGKFMTILQRQPDGSWKIHRDIFNSNVPPAPVAMPETNVDEVTAAINAIWREYEASLLAGDADRWIAQWAEDGVQMPPDMPPRVGKETIYKAVSGFLDNFEYTEFVIDNEDAQANGNLAFARGTYAASFVAKSGGDPVSVEGKYMTILRQQADGTWKLYRDIFNSNVPPAPPAAAEEIDTEAATEAIRAVWEEYAASALAGDPVRRLALWDENGIQMPPNTVARVGKETIQAATEAGMAKVVSDEYVVTPEEIEVLGDMAFARGTYMAKRTPVAGGDPILSDGKFMTILKRQEDGSWKLYRDIFNSNVPPATPEADLAALSAELHGRFSQNDLEGAAELAAEDIHMIGYGLGLDFTGRDKFLGFMQARKSVFPDITLEHTNVVVQGDQVVVEFVATGTHLGTMNTPNGPIEATGKPITLHVVEIHTWKDGKLVHLVQYQDPTAPLKQIGAME